MEAGTSTNRWARILSVALTLILAGLNWLGALIDFTNSVSEMVRIVFFAVFGVLFSAYAIYGITRSAKSSIMGLTVAFIVLEWMSAMVLWTAARTL